MEGNISIIKTGESPRKKLNSMWKLQVIQQTLTKESGFVQIRLFC